ncbi:MAG: LysR family transcriptional regulator [Parvibaculaceae bacterium]
MEKAGIDLRRLRYFIAVCEHGGFSRASNSIGVAQPALTRQVKLLEKEIGLPLVNRTGRGAEPTEDGRFLLTRSRQHLDELDEVVRKLKYRSSALNGHFVLGVCPTIAPFFVADLTAYVRDNHPNFSLSVIEAYSGDLKNMMRRNKLDLSLTYRSAVPKGLESIELFSERLVLVTGYAKENVRSSRTLSEVSRMRLVLPSGIHELRRIIDEVSGRRRIPLRAELELDSLEAVKALIADKPMQYFTILPCHSIRRELDGKLLSSFDIDDLDMQRTIAAVFPRNGRNVHAATLLVNRVRQQSTQLRARLATLL